MTTTVGPAATADASDASDASTPDRILDAAEALVAERGVDAVSLRAINAAAGVNVAASHYHFGSKDAVLEAVLRRRMRVVAERRDELIAAVARETAPSPRDVVAALVAPLAEFVVDDPSGHVYVRFLAALTRTAGPRRLINDAFAPQYTRFVEQLRRALPDIPFDVLAFRLGLVGRSLIECLAESGPGRADALIDYITGALAAPEQGGPR